MAERQSPHETDRAPAPGADGSGGLAGAIAAAVRLPLVVLDSDLRVRFANPAFGEAFRRPEEVANRPFLELCNGEWNVSDLRAVLEQILASGAEPADFELTQNLDGGGARQLLVHARPLPGRGGRPALLLLTMDDVTERKAVQSDLGEARGYAEMIVETVREPLVVLDQGLRVRKANESFYRTFGGTPTGTEGRHLYELGNRQWDIPRLRTLLEEVLPQDHHFSDFEVEHDLAGLGRRTMLLNARRLDAVQLILLAIEDVTDQRRNEGEARRLAAIVASSEDAVIGQTLEGTITSWNAGAEWVYGYQGAEVVGKPASLLAPPGAVDEVPGVLHRIAHGHHVEHIETRRIRKDGRVIEVSESISPIKDGAGRVTGASSIARDVTERKRLTDELRASEERFRLLFERSLDAIILANGAGRLLLANPAVCDLLGLPGHELLGRQVTELLATGLPAGRPPGPLRGTGEARFLRPDGGERVAEYAAAPIAPGQHLLILRDVTERRRMEESLRESEQRISAIVKAASDAIITIDEHGTVESANPATDRMFGYGAGELLGRPVKMLMPSLYREEYDGSLARCGEKGVRRLIGIGLEVQGRRKDGSTFPVDLSVSEVRGGTRLFTAILRDVTERRFLQREVLDIAAQEQRRIGRDLHDSAGQELTGLGLMAESLAEALAEQASPEAGLAAQIARGIKGTLGQVRALARGLIPVEVDAHGLRAALEELAARVSGQSAVACTLTCDGPVPVEDNATANHLYLIAQEAVTNALKHAQARRIRVILAGEGRRVTLRVGDDGVGIEDGHAEANGVGLRIMRYRAGLIDSTLTVCRALGGGTLVTCTHIQEATHDGAPDGPA
jgi:two-component system, LuxR family, sensor kinase FixL